jgi:CRISPR/Cas system-associated exonuclease Cas4 (RecB family)
METEKPLHENPLEQAEVVNGVVLLPEEPEIKEHLSASQIKTMSDCEAKWWFRYVGGYKIPPVSSLTFGSSYDDALTTNYLHKIDKKEDLPVADVMDAFVTSWDIRKKNTEFDSDEDPDAIKEMGIKLVKEYQNEIAPSITPLAAQKRYDVQFPGVDWTLVGFADLITEDGWIDDNKTKKKSPALQNGQYVLDPDHFFQLLTYSIAEKMEGGESAGNKMRITYAIKSKVPKIVVVEAPAPVAEDLKYFQSMTALTFQKIQMMKAGNMDPMPKRNGMLCSRKYCGYWSLCEEKFGGKVKS